jgi:hypothetical protein
MWTEGLGLAEADTKLCENIVWKKQRAAATGQGIVRRRRGLR